MGYRLLLKTRDMISECKLMEFVADLEANHHWMGPDARARIFPFPALLRCKVINGTVDCARKDGDQFNMVLLVPDGISGEIPTKVEVTRLDTSNPQRLRPKVLFPATPFLPSC